MPSAPVRARSGRLNTPPICNRNPTSAQSEAQKRKRRARPKNTSSASARPIKAARHSRPRGKPGRRRKASAPRGRHVA
eukprot:7093758-Alexandrium_andersonii.AAC.1